MTPRSPRSPRSRLRALAAGTVIGLAAGCLGALVGPMVLGWRPLAVMSGSMEPAISTGEVVVVRPVVPAGVRPGDVVTFREPGGSGRLVTHRVRSARTVGSTVKVVTKGDANSATESWAVPLDGRIGAVAYRVPRAGYVLAHLATPLVRLLLVGFGSVAWGALTLRSIWRPAPTDESVGVTAPAAPPGSPA